MVTPRRIGRSSDRDTPLLILEVTSVTSRTFAPLTTIRIRFSFEALQK